MVTVGLLARLEAKPGKEHEVESFLAGVLVQQAFAFLRIHLGRVEFLAGFA